MKIKKIFLPFILIFIFPIKVHAAMEYLRFEGRVFDFAPGSGGYDPEIPITNRQTIYIDLLIDTNLDVPGRNDFGFFQDHFAVLSVEGSLQLDSDVFGTTSAFPEGRLTTITLTDTMYLGHKWAQINSLSSRDLDSDISISNWVVGTRVGLYNNGVLCREFGCNDPFFNVYSDRIGSLELTYRGASAPPEYVPIPTSIALLISAFISLFSISKRRKVLRTFS